MQINAWWNTLDHLPRPRASLDEQAEEFRALFFDACRLRLRSDVPLATALSGGLDSSAIACTLAELGRRGAVEGAPKDWQRAFVACFTGTPYDERQYAKTVVDHTGMVPYYLDVDDHQALKDIEKVIFDHEGIYWFARVGPWSLYRAMRSAGIRVSIDGHGSDELIGGYHFYVERAMDAAAESLDLRRYLDLRSVLAGLIGGNRVRRDMEVSWARFVSWHGDSSRDCISGAGARPDRWISVAACASAITLPTVRPRYLPGRV